MCDVEIYVQLQSGRRIVMLGSAVPLRNERNEVRGSIRGVYGYHRSKAAGGGTRSSESAISSCSGRSDGTHMPLDARWNFNLC